jgi:hypothetical protein
MMLQEVQTCLSVFFPGQVYLRHITANAAIRYMCCKWRVFGIVERAGVLVRSFLGCAPELL